LLSVRLWSERVVTLAALESARQINAFYAGTLEAADAGAAAGNEPTVRSLLDEGTARLAGVTDAAARSALHLTLGRAYANLGRYQEAAPHLRAAVEDARAPGGDPGALAAALLAHGQALQSMGDPAGAEAAITESAALAPTPEAALAAARVRLARDDAPGADRVLEGVLSRADLTPRTRMDAAELRSRVAAARGDMGAAVLSAHAATEAARAAFGVRSDQEVSALVREAEALSAAGRIDDAARAAREALDNSIAAHTRRHPTVTWPMLTLAQLVEKQGKIDEAESLLSQAWGIAADSLPPDHYIPMFIRFRYGEFLARRGRRAEAAEELRASYEGCRVLLGPDHPNTKRVRDALDAVQP
jgi:tetratricopeptide (TPR) repeat protein